MLEIFNSSIGYILVLILYYLAANDVHCGVAWALFFKGNQKKLLYLRNNFIRALEPFLRRSQRERDRLTACHALYSLMIGINPGVYIGVRIVFLHRNI